MQRFTIVHSDNTVIVDGVAMTVDCSSLPADLHAVQWDGSHGVEEHIVNGVPFNTPISDLSAYQGILNGWTAAKADADAAKAKAEADRQAYLASIDYLRALRDAKLAALDWLVTRYHTQADAGLPTSLTADQYVELCRYMQTLRDITKAYTSAQAVVWPQAPTWIGE